MALRQPKNILPPWGVTTQEGGYVGIDEIGLAADVVTVEELRFEDGSKMATAGAGLPAVIDEGTF